MEQLAVYLDPKFLVQTLGTLGVVGIVFAESGLLFGFFLPGDSLLFTAGLLSSQGYISFWPLLIGCIIAAILGDSVGYAFGYHVGPKIFSREDSRFFKKAYLERTKIFYEKHGKKTVILARFVPIVRTFAPILAGVGAMKYRAFLSYNIAGGFGWSVLLVVSGFVLGRAVPNIDRYLLPIVLFIILLSMAPNVFEFLKTRRSRKF